MTEAVKGLKNNKAAGPDGIPAEVLKNGGHYMLHWLHCFMSCAWTSRQLPQQWKDANIIAIYKRKGDRAVCGSSRGISLLSVAGKVPARVMLRRLLTHVVDVVPESQCGFRRQCGTTDMIFVARGYYRRNAVNNIEVCTSPLLTSPRLLIPSIDHCYGVSSASLVAHHTFLQSFEYFMMV